MTFANTVSLLALFVALGGAGYAAITLPKNSVGAKQIKKNAVRKAEIKKDAVRKAEIRTGAVGADEVQNGSLTGTEFAPGTLLKGDPGAPGADGTNGTNGTNGADALSVFAVTGTPASAYPDITVTGGADHVIATSNDPGGRDLVLTQTSRVLMTGSAGLTSITAATGLEALCKLKYDGGSGAVQLEPVRRFSFPDIVGFHLGISLHGTVELPAGTYDILLTCIKSAGTGDIRPSNARAWATATDP